MYVRRMCRSSHYLLHRKGRIENHDMDYVIDSCDVELSFTIKVIRESGVQIVNFWDGRYLLYLTTGGYQNNVYSAWFWGHLIRPYIRKSETHVTVKFHIAQFSSSIRNVWVTFRTEVLSVSSLPGKKWDFCDEFSRPDDGKRWKLETFAVRCIIPMHDKKVIPPFSHPYLPLFSLTNFWNFSPDRNSMACQ